MILIMILVMIMSFIFIVSVIIKAVAPQHNTTQSFFTTTAAEERNHQLIVATEQQQQLQLLLRRFVRQQQTQLCSRRREEPTPDDARLRQTTTDRRRQTATRGRRADFPGVRGFFFRAAQYSVDLPTTTNNHSINYTYTKFSYYPPSYLPTHLPTYLPTWGNYPLFIIYDGPANNTRLTPPPFPINVPNQVPYVVLLGIVPPIKFPMLISLVLFPPWSSLCCSPWYCSPQ